MFPLMQATFLCRPALVCFMDAALNKATNLEVALKFLENHVLDVRAMRINDKVWLDLAFEPVKARRFS